MDYLYENWMSSDQKYCFDMLVYLCRGKHHIGGTVKPCGRGIEVNISHGFHASTFDYNGLTEAVVLAHDRCIRFAIAPSGPGRIKLTFHKRKRESDNISKMHPTLDEAITKIRGWEKQKT